MSPSFNILLVMPKRISGTDEGYIFNLGLPSISSPLKLLGFDIDTLNLNHYETPTKKTLQDYLAAHPAQVVATGGNSPEYAIILDVLQAAKEYDPDIITIVGGGIVSAEPDIAMEALPCADYGVIGEGEITICELMLHLEAKQTGASRTLEYTPELAQRVRPASKTHQFYTLIHFHDARKEIHSIVYRENGDTVVTAVRDEIADLDTLPWPDYEGFGIDQNLEMFSPHYFGSHEKRTMYIASGRSCPYNCSFCFHTNGKKYRQRNIQEFLDEIDYLVETYAPTFFNVVDELFARDPDRLAAFCRHIEKYKDKVGFVISLRVDIITPQTVTMIQETGIRVVGLGIESFDDTILRSMRKGVTEEQNDRALRLLHEAGIAIEASVIFGDIAETEETAQHTLDYVRNHPQYKLTVGFAVPYPGTAMYKYACEHGMIDDPIAFLKAGCPLINVSRLSDEAFSNLVTEIAAIYESTNILADVVLEDCDYQALRASIRGRCPSCKTEASYSEVLLFADDYYLCPVCSAKNVIPCPPEIACRIDQALVELLASQHRIAFWGMKNYFLNLVPLIPALRNPDIFLIDVAPAKWGLRVAGQTVRAPEVLSSENIDMVFITIPKHATIIQSTIQQSSPQVKDILTFRDLLSY